MIFFLLFVPWASTCRSTTLIFGKLFQNRTAHSVWFDSFFMRGILLVITDWALLRQTHTGVLCCVSLCLHILLSQCLQTNWLRDKALWPGIHPGLLFSPHSALPLSLSFLLCSPFCPKHPFVYAHFEFAHLQNKLEMWGIWNYSEEFFLWTVVEKLMRHIKGWWKHIFQINNDSVGTASSSFFFFFFFFSFVTAGVEHCQNSPK